MLDTLGPESTSKSPAPLPALNLTPLCRSIPVREPWPTCPQRPVVPHREKRTCIFWKMDVRNMEVQLNPQTNSAQNLPLKQNGKSKCRLKHMEVQWAPKLQRLFTGSRLPFFASPLASDSAILSSEPPLFEADLHPRGIDFAWFAFQLRDIQNMRRNTRPSLPLNLLSPNATQLSPNSLGNLAKHP